MSSSILARALCFFLLMAPLKAAPSFDVGTNIFVSFFNALDLAAQKKEHFSLNTALLKKHQSTWAAFLGQKNAPAEKFLRAALAASSLENLKKRLKSIFTENEFMEITWRFDAFFKDYETKIWVPAFQTLKAYEMSLKTALQSTPKLSEALEKIDDFYDTPQTRRNISLTVMLCPIPYKHGAASMHGNLSGSIITVSALIERPFSMGFVHRQTLKNTLPTLVHEYSHLRFSQSKNPPQSVLLDEGLATAFGMDFFWNLTGEHPPIWYNDPLVDQTAKEIDLVLKSGKGFSFFKN